MTLTSVSVAGVWVGYSDQASARALRELVAETHRRVRTPALTPTPESWSDNAITAAWLGHSTVLLNFYGVTILTDPVLLTRVGANTCLGTIGAKRFVAPALHPSELPPIDLVLLSHAHMDHLDFATLHALPGKPQAVMARAMDDLLRGTQLRSPKALGWGQKTRITTSNGDLEVRAFEVKHWGARWRYDKFRGYNGYVLAREGKQLIFGGDTAWTNSFRGLRREGPYELALMPIGAYDPWVCSHCTPEQAVRMTNDAGARHLLPIHFKTFPFGREGSVEPLQRLEDALEPARIGWRDVGETFRCA
ncbi:MAG TPA: MBL fold metallo-hydrolase [Candidatus Limnocylindrales bacterium]|nr:MBL fold metallo-hydrolase [Candidatus Limnocylindrales bacterium]